MGTAQAYHLPDWHNLSHPERLAVIRKVAMARGRDPRIARLAVDICRKAKVRPRQYEKQAAAMLAWVQDPKNVYYMNEPVERLQDPLYTLEVGHGDCDDQIILLCCLFSSVRLSWKLCLGGKDMQTGAKVRYVEGQPVPPNCKWTHIFCMVGTPPFNPKHWYFCETTVEGVPLGWDVIGGDRKFLPSGLPEMQDAYKGPERIMGDLKDVSLAASNLGQGSSSIIPIAVGASIADSFDDAARKSAAGGKPVVIDWYHIRMGVMTGVATAVGTTLVLQWLNGEGIWAGRGSLPVRWGLMDPAGSKQ